MAYRQNLKQQYYKSERYGYDRPDGSWVPYMDDPCAYCRSRSHSIYGCSVFYARREAQQKRQNEHLGKPPLSPHSNNGYHGYTRARTNFQGNHYQSSNRQRVSPQKVHQSWDIDRFIREKNLSYVEKKLAEPNLSKQDQLKFLSWKYDLLGLTHQNGLKGRSVWDKHFAKQRWIYSQLVDEIEEDDSTPNLSSAMEPTIAVTAIDDDGVKEDVYLPNQNEVSLNEPEECISPVPEPEIVEEPTVEVIEVCTNSPLIPNIVTDKCGEDSLNGRRRKVSLLDLGQFFIKWLQSDVTNRSMASRKVKARHIHYRSYNDNSVGKCGDELSKISKQGQLGAYLVNHHAFIGNVVGKCAMRPP